RHRARPCSYRPRYCPMVRAERSGAARRYCTADNSAPRWHWLATHRYWAEYGRRPRAPIVTPAASRSRSRRGGRRQRARGEQQRACDSPSSADRRRHPVTARHTFRFPRAETAQPSRLKRRWRSLRSPQGPGSVEPATIDGERDNAGENDGDADRLQQIRRLAQGRRPAGRGRGDPRVGAAGHEARPGDLAKRLRRGAGRLYSVSALVVVGVALTVLGVAVLIPG